eukprot:g1313.t1
MSLVRANAVGHGDFAGEEAQVARGKAADEEPHQAMSEIVKQRRDAEQSAPPAPPPAAPPETNHPPPAAAPQTTAADTTKKPDALSRLAGRPRVGTETLAFHAAVAAGDIPSVEAYIARNADKIVKSKASSQDDALYRTEDATGFAALLVVPGGPNGDPDGRGALSPLEAVDLRGRTPLHTACVEGQAEVVRVLLKAGANAGAFDSAGFSPLHRCAQSGNLHSARALLDRRHATGSDDGLVPAAAASPEAAANPDVDVLTRRGDYRPLHLACYAGSADMVGLLVRRGADLAAGDKWGTSPLHRACLAGHLAAARAVLDAGAEVDPRDMWKSTPLHRACQSGHADIVELLLRRGASTSAKDDIKHRPGQSFDSGVSSEQRQVIANLLGQSDKERSTTTASGRGSARSPTAAAAAWGRTRSSNASPAVGQEVLQRSQSRYIPPAARAAAAAAAAAEAGAAPGTTGTSSSSADGAAAGAGVQPWRRRTSTWSGLPEDRGPDVDGDDCSGYNARGGGGGGMGDSSFAAGRTGDGSRGSAGFGEIRGGGQEEEDGRGEGENESDDDEEMFELEISAVVEAVEG